MTEGQVSPNSALMALATSPSRALVALERLRSIVVRQRALSAAIIGLLVAIGVGFAVLPGMSERSRGGDGAIRIDLPPPPQVLVPRVRDIPPET